ncbi:uncharacterized protein LOC111691664 [Anoplophora glabripennis]|uniref:uncharacterized protein LOC111691664 n=1 Tax=Anoplophora glabripennis TaxID=217634 RepID=UPI000C76A4A9|nr:uncharacterized protein LOC111691664 [Anoplophora glabripennis]
MEILRTIAEDKQKDYLLLKTALEMRYGEAHLQHVYQAQLKGRRQRFEENLQQFEADVARMVKLAYPTAPAEFQEQLAISSFIDGLRDSEISQALRLARHKNISEALAQALEIEAARQASRGFQGKARQLRFRTDEQGGEKKMEGFVKSIQEALENLQKEKDHPDSMVYSRRRPVQCWNCGAEGHLRNRCPNNTSSQDQGNAN